MSLEGMANAIRQEKQIRAIGSLRRKGQKYVLCKPHECLT
jgi:hypothetical protein